MTTSEVGIVKAWHEALNETATSIAWWALSPLDVEVGGPRVTGRCVQLLCEWVVQG